MKTKSILLAINLLAAIALPVSAADVFVRLNSTPANNKVRIEGTSSVHDWQCESSSIGGYAEVGEGFPLTPGAVVKPGKMDAKVSVSIYIRQLKSVKADGTPYSESMDEKVYDALRETETKRIGYKLTELTLKEAPKTADAPYVFDSTGELIVAGVTNKITMPVMVTVLAENKVKFSGSIKVKMTDFKIKPPSPTLAFGLISTGDEVKLFFEWTAMKRSTNAPAAEPAK